MNAFFKKNKAGYEAGSFRSKGRQEIISKKHMKIIKDKIIINRHSCTPLTKDQPHAELNIGFTSSLLDKGIINPEFEGIY
jgi:hypothetical protein